MHLRVVCCIQLHSYMAALLLYDEQAVQGREPLQVLQRSTEFTYTQSTKTHTESKCNSRNQMYGYHLGLIQKHSSNGMIVPPNPVVVI